ncbi:MULTISPECIES: SRPBCC family protein [unclassified Streptomyces]|uniref:SRPBCC family protein n=1 Tax=unclassified Streptomyces TaxID=2593676 RepID=UPI0033DBB7FB
MAVRHQLIRRSPEAVWAVLADGTRYGDWVVGTSRTHPTDATWPRTGSRIAYTVELGPWKGSGETIARRSEPPHILELEAISGWLGTARIALELRPWGENTMVICDEHPLRGIAGKLHNAVVDALMQLRHRSMLSRLAEVVERHEPPGQCERGHDTCPPTER